MKSFTENIFQIWLATSSRINIPWVRNSPQTCCFLKVSGETATKTLFKCSLPNPQKYEKDWRVHAITLLWVLCWKRHKTSGDLKGDIILKCTVHCLRWKVSYKLKIKLCTQLIKMIYDAVLLYLTIKAICYTVFRWPYDFAGLHILFLTINCYLLKDFLSTWTAWLG